MKTEKPKDLRESIKAALMLGGLVVAPRGTGKTRAMAEILNEDPNAIVFTDFQAQVSRIQELSPGSHGRVFENTLRNREKVRGGGFYRGLAERNIRVFIDEYTPGHEYPEFFAAVTSRAQVLE